MYIYIYIYIIIYYYTYFINIYSLWRTVPLVHCPSSVSPLFLCRSQELFSDLSCGMAWVGLRENLQETMVFTIKFDGLSGSNFPIIQFYDIIHHPSPTSQPRRLQGLFQLAHLSVHRGQRRLQRGQGTASDLSHGEAMAHRNR